jgi:hypothetical protein
VQVVEQLSRLAPAVAQGAEGELGDVAGLGAPAVTVALCAEHDQAHGGG